MCPQRYCCPEEIFSANIAFILINNIINYVKDQRLSWFGHVNRRTEIRIVKKIYKWKPFIIRPVERPKFRCEDDVRNDLKKMKLIKWTEQVQDRLKWKVIVEKANTLPELKRRRREGGRLRDDFRLWKVTVTVLVGNS
jgi:hypothetical protein